MGRAPRRPYSDRVPSIVVVDDRPLMARGVLLTLGDGGADAELGHDLDIVLTDVPTAGAVIDRERPDIVVIAVPDVDVADPAFELLARTSASGAPTIAIVRDPAPATCSAVLDTGCAGVVSETAPAIEVARAVAVVLAGGEHVDQTVLAALLVRGANAVLSRRELAVLELVAEGHTGAEIARRLDVAPSTVKTHLKHVFAKLDARDRAHAVARGFRQGILS